MAISDEIWVAKTECVYVWLENNDTVYNGAIEQILNSAQEQPQDRKILWKSLRALLNVCPNNPMQNRGERERIETLYNQPKCDICDEVSSTKKRVIHTPIRGETVCCLACKESLKECNRCKLFCSELAPTHHSWNQDCCIKCWNELNHGDLITRTKNDDGYSDICYGNHKHCSICGTCNTNMRSHPNH